MQMWIREQVGFLSETSPLIITGCSWFDTSKPGQVYDDVTTFCLPAFTIFLTLFAFLLKSYKTLFHFQIIDLLQNAKDVRTSMVRKFHMMTSMPCLTLISIYLLCGAASVTSLPLQSFINTMPKMCLWASWIGMGSPSRVSPPTKKAWSQRTTLYWCLISQLKTNRGYHMVTWLSQNLLLCSPVTRVIRINKVYNHHLELNVQLLWWAKHWRLCCKKRPHT